MNRNGCHRFSLLFVGYYNQPASMMPDNHSALGDSIKIPLFSKSYYLLDRGKIKPSKPCAMFEIVGPDHHEDSLMSFRLGNSGFVLLLEARANAAFRVSHPAFNCFMNQSAR